MRFITTAFLIGLMIAAPSISLGALPPTSVQGQSGTKSTAFDFQAPYNQYTKTGSTKALLETSSFQLLKNPGFEATTYSSNWTASGGSLAAAATTNIFYSKGATWDASAASQTFTSDAITVPEGFKGNNCEASMYIKVPSGTITSLIQAWDGTNILASATIVNSTYFTKNTVTFPCPTSGTIALRLISVASDEPLIALDEGYLGLARNVGVADLITEWEAWTPTGGWTSNATYTGRWRRVGDTAEYEVYIVTGGLPTAAPLDVNLVSGQVINTAKLATSSISGSSTVFGLAQINDSGVAAYMGKVQYSSTTAVRVTVSPDAGSGYVQMGVNSVNSTVPITFGAADNIVLQFKVPIVGWEASTTATIDAMTKRGSIYFASGSATNTGSVAAFNVAGFGTNTLEGQALAPTTANDLGIRLAGAPAATYEVQATGLFYASSAATTGTRTVCQYSLYDGTTSRGHAYALTPGGLAAESNDGIGSLTGQFVLSSAGTINVVVRGQRITGNGTCYAEGPVSISIKNVSQQSPAVILQNSINSASLTGTYFNSAQVGSTGTITKETGDWISGSCSVSTAVATCTLVAGAFSTDPACHATIFGETTSYNAVVTSATTSTVVVRTFDTANAAAAAAFALTCSSPR